MSIVWQSRKKEDWFKILFELWKNHTQPFYKNTFDQTKSGFLVFIEEARLRSPETGSPAVTKDLNILFPSNDYIKHIYEDLGQYLLARKLKPQWLVHDPDGIWSSLGFYILLEPKCPNT